MIFEIKAYMPAAMSDSSGSALSGVNALFFRAEGNNPAEAYKKFLAHEFIQLELDTLLEKDQTMFINPQSCTGALVYPIPDTTTPLNEEPPEVPAAKAHLRRVK